MTRAERAKLYYLDNRESIRQKQSQYAASDAAKKAKKEYNARYRRDNKEKIQHQRIEKRSTSQFKLWKKEYYRRNICRFLFNNSKARAKRASLPFDLELSDILLPPICPILQIPIVYGALKTPGSPSIDRIVPSLGYVKGNIQIISWRANNLKSDASCAELIALGKWAEDISNAD